MDFKALAGQFWRDGFLLLEDRFPAARMRQLDDLIAGHFGADPAFAHTREFLDNAATEVIPWFPQADGVEDFDNLAADPALERLSGEILGEGWYSQYCMIMFSKPRTAGQAWHQDCPPEDPSRFNLNRLVYTRDITAETGGAIEVIKGSHRAGRLPAGSVDFDFSARVTLRPRRGALLLLHGHAWHSVCPIADAPRVSVNFRAAPARAPADITDVCVYRNMLYRFSTSSIVETRA